ncbi:OmpA family protein [Nocardia arizonensis]|uniref:OmpA family protein n=1 Tax=Nocardia arizonensis TaxID=1141647 RepID=UPI0009E8A97E|nr:OmpA family protein [Nocardia arizonensis]
MISSRYVCAIAAGAAVLLMTTACGSDNDSESSSATTTTHAATSGHATRGSAATTVSSVVSSAMNAAQQAIQNAINAALAAAPISFESGSSDLSTVDSVTLKAVALPLQGNDTRIQVTTYGKSDDAEQAKALAEARGNNIAAALEAEGIDRARVTVRAEANPTDSDIQVDQAQIKVATT